MKIAVVANTSWYLYNFRRNLMRALKMAGHEIIAVAPEDDYSLRLQHEGVSLRSIPLDGASTHPLRELCSVRSLARVLREEAPQVVLSYTPKGNLYVALALLGTDIRQIANVSGLGRTFVKQTWLTRLVRVLYRFAFGRAAWIFFQNEDDRQIFLSQGLVPHDKAERIPGSGVDLSRFTVEANARNAAKSGATFLLIARMLWDKGVGEFVSAARTVRAHDPSVRFQLLGFLDVVNPSAIPKATVDEWVREGIVEYLGPTDDIRPHVAAADCVVLPSFYREGVPRSLLEAAAMGRPLITTDATGCRDTVDHGETGYLCRPRDANDLAEKILTFLHLPSETRQRMGALGRMKMEREFDEQVVIKRYIEVVGQVIG